MRTVHVIAPEKTPVPVNVVGEAITVLAGGDLSKPFEMHIQEGVQGGGPPPHFHPWDEAFYVTDGQVEVTVEGQSTTVSAGGYVHIPGGSIHAYKNLSATARMFPRRPAPTTEPSAGFCSWVPMLGSTCHRPNRTEETTMPHTSP